VDQAKQNVLSADVVVVQHLGFFLGQDHYTASSVGKSLKHVYLLEHLGRDGARYIDGNQAWSPIVICSP
jgi:hypothetical protein